jgi:hypothetical protein
MSCGYLTRILNLGDTEMYCRLVHNEPWVGVLRYEPTPLNLDARYSGVKFEVQKRKRMFFI